jgi:hypothetical protein
MAGVSHEDYLKALFAAKAEARRQAVNASAEEKLEAWVRLLKFVQNIKAGLGDDSIDGEKSAGIVTRH